MNLNETILDDIDFNAIDLSAPDSYVLKPLVFENSGRCYEIHFNRTNILQLKGDSGTGKTLFASDLKEQRDNVPNFPRILVINYDNRELLELLTSLNDLPYDLVVIDNADIILTKELDTAIYHALLSTSRAYWIIIGRTWFDCCSYGGCRAILKSEKIRKKFYFHVEYINNL